MEVETRRPVQLLSADVIHRIAAGEVVDRPASILKELIENSLDARATHLRITIVDGGLNLIQVEDDGWGMSRADLQQAVQRHATSKILELTDLEAIHSLGFRGEALSAVSSVSRLSIETFTKTDGAWTLKVLGGERFPVAPGTRKLGTKVLVEDLFFNIPARRKFLRKPGAEAQECVDVLEALALSHPQISFAWHVVDINGVLKKQAELKASSLLDRFGRIMAIQGEIFHVHSTEAGDGIQNVDIVAFRPPVASPVQKFIRLSVNGRPVFDRRLPYALREAYAGIIEIGYFPMAQINLQVDAAMIDVNIHPQKKEIRWPQGFSLPGKIFNLVRPQFQIAERVAEDVPNSDPGLDLFSVPPPEVQPVRADPPPFVLKQNSVPKFRADDQWREPPPPFLFRELRVVGEVGAAWIVCESPRGIVLIDQHAAHERINFERILGRKNLLRSKALLVSIHLPIPLALQGRETELRSTLETLGFELSDFEFARKNTLEIMAIPEADRKINWAELLEKLFSDLASETASQSTLTRLQTKLAASLACHGSVRRGQRLAVEAIGELLKEMDNVRWGQFCPHGRPVWFELPHEQIESSFHR